MPYFRWSGINKNGLDSQGLLLASAEETALLKLSYQGIAVLSIRQTMGQSLKKQALFLQELIEKLALFSCSSLTIPQSLDLIQKQTHDLYNQTNVKAILNSVQTGQSLSASISELIPSAKPYIVALIRIGEESGRLAILLEILAAYLQEQQQLHKKILTAITPPLLTLAFTVIIMGTLMVGVVPQFERLLLSLDKPIPPATAKLFTCAAAIASPFFWGIISLLVFSSYLCFLLIKKNQYLQEIFDNALLNTPLLGKIITNVSLSRFFKIISILSEASMPLYQAATLALEGVNNFALRKKMDGIIPSLKRGKNLTQAIEQANWKGKESVLDLLSPTSTLGVNQKTLHLAIRTLEEESLKTLAKIIALIGPLLLIMVGGIIFLILIFLYLPLFNLANSI